MVTRVVAHRTLPRDAPENSLAGIRKAGEVGADFVEVDARRTRDGVPVLLHDPLLLRTTGVPLPVSTLRSGAVTKMRLLRGGGERVPTLDDALGALPDGVGMAIDTKDAGAAQAVLGAVRRAGLFARVLLWSSHERAVREFVEAGVPSEIALLVDARTHDDAVRRLDDAVRLRAVAVSVNSDIGTPEFVREGHDRGLQVYCWYQTLASQQKLLHGALDGVVTDWPLDARERLV